MKLVSTEFINQMELKLQNNSRKGDWTQWKPTEFSADVDNISMKINEQFGD